MAQYPDAGIERFSTLQSGNPGNLAGRLGPENVVGAASKHKTVWLTFRKQMQLVQPFQRMCHGPMPLIRHRHVTGKKLGIYPAFPQPRQIHMALSVPLSQPATLLQLRADAVTMAVDDQRIGMQRLK
jgi:hypothetical protein